MSARRPAGLPALVVALAGCGSAFEPGERPREQEGGYNLSIAPFEGAWTTWDREIVHPGDQHETIEVSGMFLAVNP